MPTQWVGQVGEYLVDWMGDGRVDFHMPPHTAPGVPSLVAGSTFWSRASRWVVTLSPARLGGASDARTSDSTT
jgi:hypothetical protein